ncbi:MAG: tetratricopeptide repeat protein [Bacteroidales bacterium]|jgi:tetratricopeptide (TPR) repeat protein
MKTIDFSYFIERYNAREMNEAEEIWFRKELKGNAGLREEVGLRKKTDNVLKNQDIISLRNKLSQIEAERATTQTKTSRKRVPWSIAAAVTLFILIGGSIVFFSSRRMSNEEIINKYYKPYEGLSASRSQQAVLNRDYSTAMDYYNIHDYKDAAFYFSKVIKNDPLNMESTMLYGTSNFEIRNYPEARQSFSKVIDNNDNLYMEDAHWYLALCYIRTNDKGKAMDQLSMIRNSGSIYSKEAGQILRRIK